MNTVPTYRYTRTTDGDAETFSIDDTHIRYIRAGEVVIDRQMEVPADVIASTVVDLVLAGWVWVDDGTGGESKLD